jgi:hypothetical protein
MRFQKMQVEILLKARKNWILDQACPKKTNSQHTSIMGGAVGVNTKPNNKKHV